MLCLFLPHPRGSDGGLLSLLHWLQTRLSLLVGILARIVLCLPLWLPIILILLVILPRSWLIAVGFCVVWVLVIFFLITNIVAIIVIPWVLGIGLVAPIQAQLLRAIVSRCSLLHCLLLPIGSCRQPKPQTFS